MDAYRAQLRFFDPDITNAVSGEERRQAEGVEMIPSENYTYPEVLAALGSVLTNKHSEGYPGRRYYGGHCRRSK
jgi:glycine hydroxymethyltransferase